jgi:signal transduction histidine kinase
MNMSILSRIFPKVDKTNEKVPQSSDTIAALWRLEKLILDSLDFNLVVQQIVDSTLSELGYLKLGYRIIVLCLIDESKQTLKRISISQTDEAKKALAVSPVPFKDIDIPLSESDNLLIKSLKENKPFTTHDWYDILRPSYSAEDAKNVQQIVGIKSSMVYPVTYHGKTEGAMIFSLVKDETEVTEQEKDLIRNFTDIVGLAVQNARLYTSAETAKNQITQANDQLKTANVQLQELDKLKDEFVSLASHELRTPMAAIRGSLSTILEGFAGDLSKEAREFLVAAYNENDRLIRLVNNLLNISRIESGRFEFTKAPVNLNELIIEVVNNLASAAKEKNLYLRYVPNSAIPMITTDGDKIREVLINIIGNAVKFTHQGGVTVSIEQKDGMITISMADTGSGIAKEDQEVLFKKFSQVRTSYAQTTGGTGLGLYICKIIIEGLKGKIWIDSAVGRGSTFYFSLPIVS